jgi:uncharacterized RDD family membrane protein YckC
VASVGQEIPCKNIQLRMVLIMKGKSPAGLIRRAVAFTIDIMLLCGIVSLLGLFLGILSGVITIPAISIGCAGMVFILSIPYFILLQSHIGKGQTPGERALGLRVLSRDGKSMLSPFQSALRYVASCVDFVSLGFTLITVFLTPNKQTMSDILSGSLVFREPEEDGD